MSDKMTIGPHIFNAIKIDGSEVEHVQRYDWIYMDEDGTVKSSYDGQITINPNHSTYIIYLSDAHCKKLGIDRGTSVKYDGHSMSLVDKATVDKIINL